MQHPGAGASLYTPTGHRKYLTPAERARFIATAAALPDRALGALCLVLAYTGCRISEALALTRSQVEPTEGFVAIRSLKKRGGALIMREVPVPPALARRLVRIKGQPDERLWCWSRGHAWLLVKRVMRQAGIAHGPHASPKGLRHGFGIAAIRCGIPINLVQRWLGHARMETTAIYLQAMGMEERQIAGRMWANEARL